jgi:hypothetical protein
MSTKKILTTVVALAFAGTAIAAAAHATDEAGGQPPRSMMRGWGMGPSGMMGRMMGSGRMMDGCPMMGVMSDDAPAFIEGRIAFLKAELAIADAQKTVWSAYADVLRRNFENMKTSHKTMMEAMQNKTPVERLDARINVMEKRLKMLKEIKPALGALYAALSADQRKKADEVMGMGCMR